MSEGGPVLVIGAGMAGLSCALHLDAAGVPVHVFEASDEIGGRVRTDVVNGYLLDRGFQVYLDAYPETGHLLDLGRLELRTFEPGALIYQGGRLHRLMDIFRRPGATLQSIRAPIGSLLDKARVGLLRNRILNSSMESIATRPDQKTEDYLKNAGFSEAMIDHFFRSFYGGIFLEHELQTSSRMFEFTFKMFARGSAALPAKGMGEIPKQLAARLPAGCLRLNCPVHRIEKGKIILENGESFEGSTVVIATNAKQAARLVPEFKAQAPAWRPATTLYFNAPVSPVNEPIICLNGEGRGRVNSVCVLSDASPAYAPEGRALVSVSVLGIHNSGGLEQAVRDELNAWFGNCVEDWHHLRTDQIEEALPEQRPEDGGPRKGFLQFEDTWICGDHALSASIEGAVVSGKRVAEAISQRR